MATATLYSATGDAGETVDLPGELFDGIVHEAALHQVIKAYLANQRQGNASTKTRGDVRGGGRKIWRQKGTGRARQGSIRAPHWTGGGVAHGPKPRDYHQDVPKKVRQLARRSAFTLRAREDQVALIEGFRIDEPRTRQVVELLDRIGIGDRKLLILTHGQHPALYLSARNLPNVHVRPLAEVSVYEVMNANQLLIEADALRPAEEAEEEVTANA